MARPYYRVGVRVGVHEWTVTAGDAPDYGPTDGLRMRWRMPEDKLWPQQPDPLSAELGIVAADYDDVADIDVGSSASVRVWIADPSSDPDGAFDWPFRVDGRVTDAVWKPRKQGGGVLELVVLDYTVELAELRAGATPWLAENTEQRLEAIWAAAGVPAGDRPPATQYTLTHFPVAARDVDSRPVLELLDETLRQAVGPKTWMGAEAGPARWIVAPWTDSDGEFIRWSLDPITRSYGAGSVSDDFPLPGTFGDTGAGYGPVVIPDPSRGALDACQIDMDAEWYRNKADTLTRVELKAPGDVIVTADNGGTPVVTASLDVTVTDTARLAELAAWYLPEPGRVERWRVDRFRWHLSRVPDAERASWDLRSMLWPSHHGTASVGSSSRAAAYNRILAIAGIPDSSNPGELDYYAGQLVEAELVIEGGHYSLDFRLRRYLPPPTPLGPGLYSYLAWDTLRRDHLAVTWADLDPRPTWADYRMIGA